LLPYHMRPGGQSHASQTTTRWIRWDGLPALWGARQPDALSLSVPCPVVPLPSSRLVTCVGPVRPHMAHPNLMLVLIRSQLINLFSCVKNFATLHGQFITSNLHAYN
jgi:hypothetical protein